MAYLGFDVTAAEPASDFSALPTGEYTVIITEADLVPTKAGTGKMLKLTLQVIEGAHDKRIVWTRLNIQNPNPTAQKIGQGLLKSIGDALGLAFIQDTDQIINHPLRAKINYVPPKDQYGEGNDVKAFMPVKTSTTAALTPRSAVPAVPAAPRPAAFPPAPVAPISAPTIAPPPAAPTTPVNGKVPPWKRTTTAPAADTIDADVSF